MDGADERRVEIAERLAQAPGARPVAARLALELAQQLLADAEAQLAGGAAREGDRHHALNGHGGDVRLRRRQQLDGAVDDRLRLPGPGAGDDDDVAVALADDRGARRVIGRREIGASVMSA